MISQEVQAFVNMEIGGQWLRANDHVCDISRCLLHPRKVHCKEFDPSGDKILDVWLVLEEVSATGNGLKIVFDEVAGVFGLACPGLDEHLAFLGWYGTFWDAFDAM